MMWVLKLKKPNNFVVGLIILVVVALIALGIWGFSRENQMVRVDRTTARQVSTTVSLDTSIPVSNQDFFVECRLDRDRLRSERSDMLRDVIKTAENEESRQKARNDALKLVLDKERETEIESLIKARGFTDALVLVQDNTVSVVIKTNTLSREDVVQVADVISRVSGAKPEDITISAKP
ncbi:MAG: SpoIIIAH-like protein [Firmicutes bacterium]|nr:SpoIIIAH-like protein [Bacillota bacterium]